MPKYQLDTFKDLLEPDVKELSVDYGEVFIRINTGFHTKGIQFLASVHGSDTDNLAAHFVIRTTNWETGKRHPYFERHRASELAARAIRHFEATQPVKGIEFTWVRESCFGGKPSDNYTTYIETRDRLRDNLSIEEARRQAALATWTMQRIALPNGFTKLRKITELIGQTDDHNLPTEVKGTVWRELPI